MTYDEIQTELAKKKEEADSIEDQLIYKNREINELKDQLKEACPHPEDHIEITRHLVQEPKCIPWREERKRCRQCGKLLATRTTEDRWGEWR